MKGSGLALAAVMFFGAGLWGQGTGENYRGAGVSGASDIPFPADSAVTGLVTLGVAVDGTGAVQNVTVIRDLPPLTAVAQQAMNSWKFSPAVKDGKFMAGSVRVHVVFNPFNPGDTGITGAQMPNASDDGDSDADFQPAQVQTATFAQYPENTVASGTVLVQLSVDADGVVQGARVMRGAGPLAGAVTRTVKSWAFTPATYKGNAVRSVVPVAFVFASPAQGTQ